MIVVPAVAFDKNGYRIGYGGGFYDKFLSKIGNSIKVGIAYNFQIVNNIIPESHDIKMDYIVTEEKIITV